MSVGSVNITQRKQNKDTLHLLHRKLLKPLSERQCYIYPTTHKRKMAFRE